MERGEESEKNKPLNIKKKILYFLIPATAISAIGLIIWKNTNNNNYNNNTGNIEINTSSSFVMKFTNPNVFNSITMI